nr:RecName: Full=Hemocyanin subunit II [Panulirus japonicus]
DVVASSTAHKQQDINHLLDK